MQENSLNPNRRNRAISLVYISIVVLFFAVSNGECGISDYRVKPGHTVWEVSNDGSTILWWEPDVTWVVEERDGENWELPDAHGGIDFWAIDNSGGVVGWVWNETDRWEAAIMEKTGGVQLLGTLNGTHYSSALDISGDGSSAVGYSINLAESSPVGCGEFWSCDLMAMLWTDENGIRALPPIEGFDESSAFGVSADGRVVAGESASHVPGFERLTDSEATIWIVDDAGDVETIALGQYDAQSTWVEFLSTDGSVAAGAFGKSGSVNPNAGSNERAFRWTEAGGIVPLGLLPGTEENTPTGISNDGSIIVGNGPHGYSEMFVWDTLNGIRDLKAVLVEEHGLDSTFFPAGSASIHSISGDAKTIGGSYGSGANRTGWAIFLDRPLVATPSAVEPADLNVDGFVDGLDLGILLGSFNTSTTPDKGELDGTPPVDGLDLGLLLGAWSRPPLSPTATIPEPASAPLLLVAAMSLGARRTTTNRGAHGINTQERTIS